MVNVMLRDLITNNQKIAFTCETGSQAINVARHMNHLNEQAAKLTGKAIRFVYTILVK